MYFLKAEEMLRKSMKWRKENEVDTILEREGHTIPPDMVKLGPIAFCGISKDGYGVFVAPWGRHDLRSHIEKYGTEECLKYNTIFMEKMVKIMQDEGAKVGMKVTQMIEIADFEG